MGALCEACGVTSLSHAMVTGQPAVVHGIKEDNKFCIVIVHVFICMYSMCWLCVCTPRHYTLSAAYNYYNNFSQKPLMTTKLCSDVM